MLLPALPAVLGMLAPSGWLGVRGVLWSVVFISLMAAATAMVQPGDMHLEWLLLGATLGLDETSRALLVAAALLWPVATITERELFGGDDGPRFSMCFLLTLSGSLGVLISQDAATFYLSFAVMTFAAYGLVVHDGTREAVRAGRIYLILAIAGEGLLLSGLFLMAAQVGNPVASDMGDVYSVLRHPGLVGTLLLSGFAVKMGVIPLHVWLPLAHPAAPVPASAILSGLLVKGGLLGWLRFLPPGDPALPAPGDVLAVLGIAAAFLAALVGCFQQRAKTVLAYSTVSQMGLLTLLAGTLIAGRGDPQILIPAITVFAAHHALVKGSLFLAVAHLKEYRLAVLAATIIAVLALAGAPFTSGLVAKAAIKSALPASLTLLVTLTSVTTSLLLLRFLLLAWPTAGNGRSFLRPDLAVTAWLLLLAASQALPWMIADSGHREYSIAVRGLVDAIWPLLLAAAIAWAAARTIRPWRTLPEGDVVVPVERLIRRAIESGKVLRRWIPVISATASPSRWKPVGRLVLHDPDSPWTGVLLLFLVLLLPLLYLIAAY